MEAVYLKVTAGRRIGEIQVERFVKISEGQPMIAVDVHYNKITTVKGLYSAPYVLHPSNENQFLEAYHKVEAYHKSLLSNEA